MDFGVSEIHGEPDVPWMVAEWVDGQTLAGDLKARRGRGGRSPHECLLLLKPVFDALAYAHGLRIVHRDIKPANLMFTGSVGGTTRSTSHTGTPQLKLSDFGIAKVMESEEAPPTGRPRRSLQQISFSARYGAPEQFSGARTGPWTDVHAMVLLLTELLTDRAPYEARGDGPAHRGDERDAPHAAAGGSRRWRVGARPGEGPRAASRGSVRVDRRHAAGRARRGGARTNGRQLAAARGLGAARQRHGSHGDAAACDRAGGGVVAILDAATHRRVGGRGCRVDRRNCRGGVARRASHDRSARGARPRAPRTTGGSDPRRGRTARDPGGADGRVTALDRGAIGASGFAGGPAAPASVHFGRRE